MTDTKKRKKKESGQGNSEQQLAGSMHAQLLPGLGCDETVKEVRKIGMEVGGAKWEEDGC